MFEAFVFVCEIYQPSKCSALQEMLGPYHTKVECNARIEKMKKDIVSVAKVTDLMPKDSICKIKGEEA